MTITELGDVEFGLFQKYIYEQAGIRLADHKKTLVSNRLRRRVKETGSADYRAYYRFLTSPAGEDELRHFLDAITTNETYFFRDEHQYKWLGETFLGEAFSGTYRPIIPKCLKIWSAACSTGEEPYSIALSFQQRLTRPDGWKLSVVGTDLSSSVLRKAEEGVYNAKSLQLVNDSQRKRFFKASKDAETWTLNDAVREVVTFRRHNLLKKMTGGPFDCIFIKNVLIYFDEQSKRVVVGHLLESLGRGGYLVVGPSEGIFRLLDPLEKVNAWLYKKPI